MRLRMQIFGIVVLMMALILPHTWAQESPTPQSFELNWQEQGLNHTRQVDISQNLPVFAVEPQWNGRQVKRGHLTFDLPSMKTIQVGLIWDRSDHKLYIDLNQDDDLTNDPNGILTAEGDTRYYQHFPPCKVELPTPLGVFRYRLQAEIYSYREENLFPLNVHIHSGYSGQIDLHGTRWSLSVNDGFHGTIDNRSRFHMQASTSPDKSLANQANLILNQPIPPSLYLDGYCYDLAFQFRSSDQETPALWCTFTEKQVPVADLDIRGQFINQLVFGDAQMLVAPLLTDQPVSVPTGQFSVREFTLAVGQKTFSPTNLHELEIDVQPDQHNSISFGGPLTSSVSIERSGSVLEFNFEISGAGGERYSPAEITDYDSDKKPKVTIYKGDLKLASGDFEYG